ncbi:hypothetical protein ACI7BZ_04005 [Xanthobacter sp. AM11]|uniref:hypothetical protein n=1 Tax=Xanthobacter sp. AM11 TaxID=3380643 RepID=UPI0039BF2DB8
MPHRALRLALAAGALLVPLLGGGLLLAPAPAASAAKAQDRIRQEPAPASGAIGPMALAQDMMPDMMPPSAGPDRPARPPRGRPPGPDEAFPPPGPLGLAQSLAAAEAQLGIRAGQIDAWRDFTDALLEVARPPFADPPRPPAPGAGPAAPLALTAAFAARVEEAGKAATRLIQAADALKTRLTPRQLEQLARIEPALLPPPPAGPPHAGPLAGPPPKDRLPPR